MAVIYSDELCHYGIKGQKWGFRRYQNPDGSLTTAGKARYSTGKMRIPFFGKKKTTAAKVKSKSETQPTAKKTSKEMSNDELASAIRRMELEQRYSQLSAPANAPKLSAGRKFVNDVLYQSSKQVATQLATYAMGTAINKAVGKKVINIKEAQKKDKDEK